MREPVSRRKLGGSMLPRNLKFWNLFLKFENALEILNMSNFCECFVFWKENQRYEPVAQKGRAPFPCVAPVILTCCAFRHHQALLLLQLLQLLPVTVQRVLQKIKLRNYSEVSQHQNNTLIEGVHTIDSCISHGGVWWERSGTQASKTRA